MSANCNMRVAQMGSVGALALTAPCIAQGAVRIQLPATHDASIETLIVQPLAVASNDNHIVTNRTELSAAALVRAGARFLQSASYVNAMTRAHSRVRSAQASAMPAKKQSVQKAATSKAKEFSHTRRSKKAKTKKAPKSTPITVAALSLDAPAIETIAPVVADLPEATASMPTTASSLTSSSTETQPVATDAADPIAPTSIESNAGTSSVKGVYAQFVLRAAGIPDAPTNPSPFARSNVVEQANTPEGRPRDPEMRASKYLTPVRSERRGAKATSPSRVTRTVGRSPAFLINNIKSRKALATEPAQIVRIATAGTTKRRIVFAQVPGTRSEYRLKGIDHQQKPRAPQERSATHALMAPHVEHASRTTLGLAPRSAGARPGGETAYTMPDPRELRADEAEAMMAMIKEQLALGPASLNDPAIRERFNGFLFSNTVGEMSHYVTADQWNGMMRAAILYAIRAVLPFSNNSIAHTAAAQLFDGTDASSRYAEWMKHFDIVGLGEAALVDTFLADDRILTMPEYFFKAIMDQLLEGAAKRQGYDEDVLPLPFTTELHLQWETIGFITDPAITNDDELIESAATFTEEIAALDTRAAQHFLELVLLSTMIKTDSIQGVWSEEQAISLIAASINAGMSDVVDPIGRNRQHPRRVRRLVALAKERVNAAADEGSYDRGLEMLTRNLAEAIRTGVFSIEPDESEELHTN